MTITEVQPDDRTLRLARRERVLAEMDAAGVDVLVLGREANARYVAGVPRLWLAGTRPFGPGCVLVRATGAVHLMTTWDEGVPEDIPHEHLYGISFNASTFLEALRTVDGAEHARTVATDAMNAGASKLLAHAFPAAELVDGEQLMQGARRVKLPMEVDAIRASVAVAERALAAAEGALERAVTERELTGVFMEAMAGDGVTIPSTQDIAWVTSRRHPWHRSLRDAPIRAGDLVAFEAGVIRDGYVGELGRTRVAGGDADVGRDLLRRRDELWDRLLDACRPGVPSSDLLEVYRRAGVTDPPMPVARGLGLGYDMPVVANGLPSTAADQRLEVGMVLALTAFVWDEGVGAAFGQEPVVITETGPELLSTSAFRDR